MAQCEMPELRVLDVALPLLGGALVFGLTLFLVAKYYIGVEDDTITERVVTENANVERANSTSLATVKDQNGHLSYLLYPSILVLLASTWYQQVNSAVREPYLDEFFHVRQAQVYCHTGNFTNWDPKITTPPGLYLLSYVLHLAGQGCDISTLRLTNASAIVFTWIPIFLLLRQQQARERSRESGEKGHAAHTALNISLFPPLFFFSALYYTDIVSTEVVLWNLCLRGNETLQRIPIVRGIVLVLVGTLALGFRQTNVFWVGVFNAALDAVGALKHGSQTRESSASNEKGQQHPRTLVEVMQESWKREYVYNVPTEEACFEDYVISVASLAISALVQLPKVTVAVLSQVSILLIFASFVIWNGGVVLGDKSNHIATLHTPQMLYIWPYMLFFSPIILIIAFSRLQSYNTTSKQLSTSARVALTTNSSQAAYLSTRVLLFLAFTAAALTSVHFNTIIHPFTLADNRHYVFYIFRILRKHWALKYLAAPVYAVCAWLALTALGGQRAKLESSDTSTASGTVRVEGKPTLTDQDTSRPTNAAPTPSAPSSSASTSSAETTTSTVLIWLFTTTLTLVTAPLVEPRYFILPWLVWRLHVLPSSSSFSSPSSTSNTKRLLWAETAWFVLINVATGYMFLHRGFEWSQEPGNVQRFLW